MKGKLLPLIPEHHCFVEVFGGGASLLFAKEPSKVEVYNDIDGDVVAFFKVFHDPEALEVLKRKCFYTPYSRDLYAEYKRSWKEQTDPIERIYRWFIMVRMAFNGGFGAGGASFTDKRNAAKQLKDVVDNFEIVVDRLRVVQIENDTWQTVLDRYDSTDTFFYLDPPYVLSTRTGKMYNHEMTDADHTELIQAIENLKGKVLLSGYDNPIYKKLSWHHMCFDVVSNGSIKTESLWRNYPLEDEVIESNRIQPLQMTMVFKSQ